MNINSKYKMIKLQNIIFLILLFSITTFCKKEDDATAAAMALLGASSSETFTHYGTVVTVTGPGSFTEPLALTSGTIATGTAIANGTTPQSYAGDNSSGKYYYTLPVAAGKSFVASISNLTCDVDLGLYDTNGSLLASSISGGTAEDALSYMNTSGSAQSYLLFVGGYMSCTSVYDLLGITTAVPTAAIPLVDSLISGSSVIGNAPDNWTTPQDPASSNTDGVYYGILIKNGLTLTVNLTGLSCDVDLAVYNGSGTQLARSINAGTTDDNVSYTNNTGSNQIFLVFAGGWSGCVSDFTLDAVVN